MGTRRACFNIMTFRKDITLRALAFIWLIATIIFIFEYPYKNLKNRDFQILANDGAYYKILINKSEQIETFQKKFDRLPNQSELNCIESYIQNGKGLDCPQIWLWSLGLEKRSSLEKGKQTYIIIYDSPGVMFTPANGEKYSYTPKTEEFKTIKGASDKAFSNIFFKIHILITFIMLIQVGILFYFSVKKKKS